MSRNLARLAEVIFGVVFGFAAMAIVNGLGFIDRIRLQQVILKLAANGIDEGRARRKSHHQILRASKSLPNYRCRIVDRAKLKEVFEPFFTSGGRDIARTIIKPHHGLIWAENRDHGGASFPDQTSSPIAHDARHDPLEAGRISGNGIRADID